MVGSASGGSRVAAILFTDIVASTAQQARLGDAAAHGVRRRHDDLLTEAVVAHDGSVVKMLGDGGFAAFTSAAGAVACALAAQQAFGRTNLRAADDERLSVRMGLSVGDVIWEDGDCHGTPVVTASRLCDRADGGQVLCDDLVRGLARGRADLTFRLVGDLELKGLPEPVVAYDVPWEAVVDVAPLPAPLLAAPNELAFGGRDEERATLNGYWKSARVDGRITALVVGEPGSGKTRLASELARSVHADAALVLLGRCEEQLAAPFAPWIEALRHLVANVETTTLAGHIERHGGEVTRLVPELARRLDDVPPPRSLDPDIERLVLFDAVVDLLAAACEEAPTLLVIDDAHWSDAASLLLLRHAVRHLPLNASLLTLVTYRDTDVDRAHPLSAMLADLRREPRVERLLLKGLDEPQMRALLVAIGGHELEDEGFALAARLVEETEGNPFFVTELLRHLAETGALVQQDGRWVVTVEVDEMGLPEGVRDLVGRRLSRLSDDANEVLRTAAVIGREFDVAVLAPVADLSEVDAVERLDEAIATSLLAEVADRPGRLSFSHALVRSTLLDELSLNRRIHLHRKIAETLEAHATPSVAELAYHFGEAAVAGVADKAVAYGFEAATEAMIRLAYDESIQLLERALEAHDLGGEPDTARRSELLSRLAMAHHGGGDSETGRQVALRAVDEARTVDDPARLAEAGLAYVGLTGSWARPADPIGVDLMREGLARLDDRDAVMRARVTASLSHSLLLTPGDEALRLADEAHALAAAADDDLATGMALTARAWATRGQRPAAEAEIAAEAVVEFGKEYRRDGFVFAGNYHVGAALVSQGDLDGARKCYEFMADVPSVLSGWSSTGFAAVHAYAQGRHEDAATLSDRAHELGSLLGDSNDGIWCEQRALIAHSAGDAVSARKWASQGQATAIGLAIPTPVVIEAETGNLDAAREALTRWEDEIQPAVPALVAHYCMDKQVRVITRLDDQERATSLWPELEPYSGEFVGSDIALDGAIDLFLGMLAGVLERVDDAVDFLESAAALHERMDLPMWTAYGGVELGRALQRRRRTGDHERADQTLRAARQLAAELRTPLIAAEADALLD